MPDDNQYNNGGFEDVQAPTVDQDNNQEELFDDGANVQQNDNQQNNNKPKKKKEKKEKKNKIVLIKKSLKYIAGTMVVIGGISLGASQLPNILQSIDDKRIENNVKNGNLTDYYKVDTVKLYDPEQTSFDEILKENSDVNKEFERLNKLSVVGKKIELLRLEHDLVDNDRYEFLYSDLDVDKLNTLYDLYFQYKNTRESQDPACKEYSEFQEICKILDGSQKAIDLYSKTTGMDVLRDYAALVYEAEIVDYKGYDYTKMDEFNLNPENGAIDFKYDGTYYNKFRANPELVEYLNGDNAAAALEKVKEEIDSGKGFSGRK